MKSVVVTGSSRGIGFGMAREFLARGHNVVVSGSTDRSTEAAREKLVARFGDEHLLARPCDVRNSQQLQALWDAGKERFAHIDIWINNAGVTHTFKPIWEQPPEELARVLEIDALGALLGSRVACKGMLAQGSGHLYNMEGFGSNGMTSPGLMGYGMAKRGVHYLNKTLAAGLKGTGVKASRLGPGMVVTDFILDQEGSIDAEDWERTKKVFNILGEKEETVTPWLVEQVLANDKNGANLNYLTTAKAALRFALSPLRKRDLFDGATGAAIG